jgi:hypothetical protein
MSKINIMALRHSAFYSPLLMTIAGGFLADEGLEYEYKVETPDCTVAESIRNGNCHMAQSAVAASFAALERGQTPDFIHFAQINSKDGFFIAAREPDANFTWHKLIGKKVLQYVINSPAEEIAASEKEAGFFTHIDPLVLTDTIKAYQTLGCWQAEVKISKIAYENLLEVFLFSGGITQLHAYDKVIAAPPE